MIRITVTDYPSRNISIAPRSYETSFDPTKKNDYNVAIGIDEVITNDRVIEARILGTEEDDPVTVEEIMPLADLEAAGISFEVSGYRGIDHLDNTTEEGTSAIVAIMQQGWEEAKNAEYDNVVVFFEPHGYDALNATMLDVRTTHKFSRVVQPVLKGTTQANVEMAPDRRSEYANHHGLTYVWNEVLTRDPDTRTAWWRFPVGAYCTMLVRIMRQKNGAWAPMFVNDAGNIGGQLDAAFEEIRVKRIDEALQQELDEAGFNTLVNDPNLGLVVVNQRTAQNPSTINDASWLSHDMAFDLFKRAVQQDIMFPQIGKPIDGQYIGLRSRQLTALGGRFANAFSAIRHEVASINTDTTRAQRRFLLATAVKVTPFSEFVDFMFYNVGQESSVDDPFEGVEN